MVSILIMLFFIFSIVNVDYSLIIWLTLFWSLILISFFEFIAFQITKKNYLTLGKLEESKNKIKDIIIALAFIGFCYFFIEYSYLIGIETNQFKSYFFGKSKSNISDVLILLTLLKSLVIDNTFFYITKEGLVTHGDYFQNYLWKDFKEYSLIEEQSLIRFKNKNDKFLFIKYEESYFQEDKIEITTVLNKNIPYV